MQRAAERQGSSVSDFVVAAAEGAARKALEKAYTIDIRRQVSACYVAREMASDQIAGNYTLSAAGIFVAYRAILRCLPPASDGLQSISDIRDEDLAAHSFSMPLCAPCVRKWPSLRLWLMRRTKRPRPFIVATNSPPLVPAPCN